MANSDKNIRITANRDTTALPKIIFTGQSNNPIALNVLDDNTISFEGSAGQLFSINNNLSSGYIFSINDISGIPSFRVNADGTVGIAEFLGNVGIGLTNPAYKLQISGSAGISGTANISGVLTLSSTTGSGSTSTGALVVSGGVGIGGSIFSSSAYASSLSGVVFNNGAITNTGTITSTGVMSISNSSTTAFQVRDGSNSSKFNVDTIGGIVSVLSSTASTSTSSGALVVSGGVGIGGSVIVGGRVGIGTVPNLSMLNIQTSSAGTTGLSISASTSQSANLLEWYADLYGGGGFALAGTVRPTGQVHLGTPGFLTMSNGGSALLGLQGRGTSEGLAIRGYNSNLNNPLFEVQGNPGNQLFGIYGDGGVNALRINVTNSTGSTNSSSGALIVTGGVGIGGSLYVTSATAISGVTINAGVITGSLTGTATTATYSHQSGYAITTGSSGTATTANNVRIASAGNSNSNHLITFTPNSSSSGSAISSDSTFSFNPSTEILSVSGIAITSTTASTSTTTGALIVAGGVGIGNTLYVAGRVDASNYKAWVENRTLSSLDTCVGIGTFYVANGAHNLLISLNVSDGGYGVAKNYTITTYWNAGGWRIVAPTSATPGGNDFQLEAYQLGDNLTLRARSLSAGSGNNLQVYIQNTGRTNAIFSPYNTSTSESALTIYHYSAFVSQEFYVFKINSSTASTSTSTGALVVTGGVGIGQSLFTSSSYASSISGVTFNNGAITNTGTITSTGVMSISNSSTTAFAVRDGSNSSKFNVDTVGGIVSVLSSTASTTPTTGALVVSGGVGISGGLYLKPSSSSTKGIVVQANTSQTGNLFELQGSTGTVNTYFTSDGKLRISGVINHADGSTPKISVYHDNSAGGGILVKGQNSDALAAIEVQSNSGTTFRAFPSGFVEANKYTGYQIVLNSTVYPGSTEFIMFNSPTGLMEFNAAGTIALQRNFNIQGHILRFSGSATTISKAVVVQLSGANSAGSNCTIDENIVFRVLTNNTTAKGIVVQAATSQTANLLEIQNSSSSTLTSFNAAGELNITSTTGSTSTSSGALVVTGGVGIGGSLYVASATAISGVTINAGVITGSLTGTATTATYSHQSGYATTSGLATTATYSHQSGYATTSGLATTATYSHQSGYATTSGLATTATYANQSGYGITAGLATTATYAHQSGYAITSGSSGSATTANNINVANALSNSAHTLLFSPTATGSGVAVSSNTTLSYNPSSNVLSTSGLAITATTASSSTSNGALQVAGGVGISGRLSFNQAAFGTTGIATNPTMAMIGNTGDPIFLSILEDNTISFEGSQGQLFSITPNLSTGYIYSVNDITGIPLLRANSNANVTANEYAGNFGIGLSNPGYKLHVVGSVGFTSTTASTSTNTGTLVVSGGVGIGGSLNVNSPSNISNVIINNGVITGNLTGTATTSGFATTASYSNQAGYAITAGSATTANYSHQAGYAITAGSATTAFTAVSTTSVSVASAGNSNLAHPILITNNPSSGSAVSSDSTFTFNPSTEILNVSGISITSSTGSSNTTTGALIVTGGVGIGGSFNVGNKSRFNDEVYINSLSNNALYSSGSGGVAYNWSVGGNLSSNKYFLGLDLGLHPVGGNQSIVQTFWGLQLVGNSGVVPSGYTPSSVGVRDAIGVLVPNQQAGRVAFGIIAHASQTADLQIWTSSTASTSSPYLAVKADGQIYSYANIPATSFSSGALVVSGGVGIGGSLFVNGDLTINGTTTTINSVTLSVDDKNIELGSVSSPSDVTAEGGGITLKGATDKFINWYSGVGWSSSESWNLVSGNSYKINNASVLNATTLGTGVTNSSLTSLGTITTGVWAGTLITANYGGVGLTTPFTVGDILYANTSTTWGRLTAGTSGHLLSSTGTGSTPSYVNPNTLTVGSATTASNLRIAVASSNLSHPVLFTPGSSTSGSAVSSDSTFSFNSSTEILSVSGVAITSTTSSSGSTTGALTVAGGVGIGGTVNIAGDETVLGRLYYSQSTVGVAGTSTIPSISFIGQDNNPITLSVLTDNTLSFEGSSGQLFSINNNLSSGTIFSVNDISGIPIIRANANGTLSMGEFTGTVGVGLTNPSFKFHVSGSAGFSGTIYATGNVSLASNTASTSTTNGALTVSGGVGIGGSLYVASATAISGVTINAGVITGSLTGTASTATYSHQSGYAITSGFATTASYAYQSGYAITSGSSGSATTAFNINIVSATTNASHPVLFTPASGTASGAALSTESTFVYNPSTDILSVSGLAITSGTASIGPTSGALVVAGGVGISGSLRVGDRANTSFSGYQIAGFAVSFNNNANFVIQNAHPGPANHTRLFLANDLNNYAEIRYANSHPSFSFPNYLNIQNDFGNIHITAGSGFTINMTSLRLDSTGAVTTVVTASTSPTTGGFRVAGGAGIAKTSYFGQDLIIQGTTGSGSTTTGALIVSGGVGIGQTLFTSSSYASSISGVVFNNGAITNTGTITSTGVMSISNSSTTAFSVKDGSNDTKFNVNTIGGIVSVSSSTVSTNTSTGAFTVSGGVGIGGTLNVNSVVTYNRLQNQSFSGSSVGSTDGRMGGYGAILGHDRITFGNGIFVTNSSWGAYNAAYSTDGLNWTASSLPVNQGYPVTIYGNGYFVLAATGATNVLYSANGSSWSQVSIGNTESRTTGAYGNGKYVIVGGGTTYNYSSDLLIWSTGTLPLTGDWRIAYGNGVFVAIAYGTDRLIYSYDGINWNIGNTNSGNRNFQKITYTNGKFMVTAWSGGGTWYSYDGINWVLTSNSGGDVYNLSYGNGAYFTNDALKYTYSSDGFNWSSFVNFSAGYESFQSAYGLNKFITGGRVIDGPTNTVTIEPKFTGEINNVRIGAVTPASGDFTNLSSTGSANLVGTVNANNLNILSKVNQTPVLGGFAGTNGWASSGLLSAAANYGLAFGNGLFVSIRKTTNSTSFSSDGKRWVASNMPFAGDWMSIAWGVDKFVAVASTGTTGAYSGNGISWTSMSMPASAQGWYAVTYGDDKFVAVGNTSTAAYSSDGISWTGSSIANTNWTGVAYGNGTFVAVAGFGQSAVVSYDGINWNLVNLPSSAGGIKFITYGNGYFIVTNYVSNDINYSRDGINWSTSTRTSTYGIKTDIAYGNGIYSIFNYQEATYSYDGVNWLLGNTIAATDWQAVAYGNNRFVATSVNTGQVGSIDGPSNTLNLHPKFTGDIDNVRIGAKQPGAAEFTNLAAQQPVRFTANTASVNTNTGALVVVGGVGIGGSLYVASATAISGVTINAGVITGSLTGTASTATYSHQSGYAITSGSSGAATTATYAHQSGYATTSGFATTATYSYQSGYGLTSGLATTATYSHQSGYATTSGLATTATYAHQSGYATTSGLATTATYSYQSGYGITAGFATSATSASIANTSYSVNVNAASTNASHFLIFSPTATGSGVALSSESALVYNPSTDILSVSGLAVTSGTASTSATTGALVVTGGVGIGLTLTVGLGISTPVISAPANLLLKPGVDSTTGIQFTRSSAALPVLTIDTLNSRVGIGLTNPEFDFEVNGSISATTKSFVIEHPTKQGMKLRYGSLEGPENGVYVRGELKDNNTIILPDYWSELVDESSITVHLTPIGNKFVYVKEIKKDSIIVGSKLFQKIHCYYSVWAERKDVPKLKVEF